MTKRFLTLAMTMFLAVSSAWGDIDFGTEKVVSTEQTWVFGGLKIQDDAYNSITNTLTKSDETTLTTDYYLRGGSNRKFSVKSANTNIVFADGYNEASSTAYIRNAGAHNSAPDASTTAGGGSKCESSFAFNAEVAGTVYAKVKYKSSYGAKFRIYFCDGSTANYNEFNGNSSNTNDVLEEIAYTSTGKGSFFITSTASGAWELYGVRFVPSSVEKESVSTTKTWTFNNKSLIGTGTVTYAGDGLYMRGYAGNNGAIGGNNRSIGLTTLRESTNVTLNGEVVSVSKVATTYASFQQTTADTKEASSISTSAGTPTIAIKTTVPGTLYVAMTPTADGSGGSRIYFGNGTDTPGEISTSDRVTLSTAGTIYYANSTSTEAGTFFVGANVACKIYALRFIPTHSVTAATSTGADTYGTVSAASTTVAEGATTTITAEPATGYQVSNWAVSGTGASISPTGASNDNTTTLTMGTADATVTCTFAPINYDITVNQPASGGSFTVKVGDADAVSANTTANYNQTITLANTPSDGFVLSSYSVTKTASSESITVTDGQFTMPNEAVTITATFVDNTPSDVVPVIIVAGQSNTDGRAMNDSLPQYIRNQENDQYPHVYWSYGNGTNDKVTGTFDKFWPACDASPNTRWAYDAVVYFHLQQTLNGSDLYVIKESKGGTAINTGCSSTGNMWWSADDTWLSSATSADADGQSLLLALKDNIDQSLTTLANANKTADIKFLMWHQGEADKGKGTEYQTQLQQVITYIRNYLVTRTGNEAYANLPIILGGIKSTTAQYSADVEAAKQAIATDDANVYYVSSEDLPVNAYRQDNLHFNFKGAEMFGKRVYDLIVEHQLLGNYTYAAKSPTNYPPVISFNSETKKVTIENDADSDATGGSIYYTTDGSTPTSSSTAYSEPFSLALTSTVKAISIKNDLTSFVSEKNIAVPSPAVTYDFAAVYPASETFTLPTSGTDNKTTVYYYGIAEKTPADANYGFYHITSNTEKMPVNGRISWKAGTASLVEGGMKCGNTNRYFAIHDLCEGDKIRIVFTGGTIQFAKHSSKGNAITDLATNDELTSDQEYTVSSIDATNNYVVFYPTNGTIISQIYINVENTAPQTPTKPTVTLTTDGETEKVYTVTFLEGETLHYTSPSHNGEQTLEYSNENNGSVDITVSESGNLVCWTTVGETESEKVTTVVTISTGEAPTAAVTYDFMAAYAADKNITPAFSETDVTVYYNRDTDETGTKRSGASYPMEVNTTELPVNGTISCFNKDQTITEKGLNTKASRPFAIHNLKVGDVIRIEFDGALYYAKSTYNGGKGNALEGLTTGDVIKNLKDYTVSSIDAENNYVVFFPTATTIISQISINEELTMKFVPKPTVSTTYTENEDSYTYAISYQDGATLHYTLPGGEEQTKVGGESLNVNVTKIGDLTAYATLNSMTSETVSQRVYAPTPAIANGEVYDFALLNGSMLKDYTLGTHGYGDAITIGGMAMKKPDAVVAKTLDRFAFTSEYTEEETTKDGKEWMLLSAGRLRAKASAHDDKMAILNVKKGQYLTLTYSGGAAVKYLAGGTATMAENTDTLFSGKSYEILTDGNLLLTIPANADSHCDITGISLASTETVTAPTIEARTEINKVTLRLGTSSFGKTVTAYYTLDGSTPTTSSTAVTKNGAITVDESCTMKAYCVSETGVASGVTEYTVSLPAASKSDSKVYDFLNVVQHGDEIVFATDGQTVYDKEYDATNGWVTKKRTDFNAATTFDSKVSVRSGASGVVYDTKNKTIRLTKPLAIHNLAVDDEIVIIYTGDGSLYSGAADEGDVFTVNGNAAPAGTVIKSGAKIKVTRQKYENNYVVVTPSGTGSGKVFISSIYINHAAPTVANTPKCELATVNLDKMESTYRFTFDEGAMLFYMNTADNETLAGSNTGTFDITVTESAKLKAWEVNGTLISDTLSVTVYAPTPAPSTTGNFDFTEASEDLPADIEVTLDASKSVTVGGEILYKPSALTAATFGDKFAFTGTNSSNKIRIRTNHQLVFAKGTNMSMGLLNLKKGDIIAFNYTGSITFADPSQVSVESPAVAARAMTRTVSSDMTSGTAYVVQADGNILLNLNLTEESTSISKMYIAAAPTAATPAAIDFATASENYEEVETGSSTSVYIYGKSSAQTFKRLVNSSDELPIDGMISTESGSGEITADGIKAANRHIAIHNLAAGDKITISFFGGALTYGGHETYGNRVSVDGKTLAAQDALTSGDVMVVEKVDYLNNYVVLKLDSKCCISGIFINRDEEEKVWAPTIVESGKNTVLITAGRSSLGYQVTTYYTTDGTDPSDRNGIGGPYESYDVELLDGALVPVKAISYSVSGKVSNITTFNIFADMRTDIIGVSVEDNKQQVVYDLQGRKVETPMEGRIYIIDGKKVLYRRK